MTNARGYCEQLLAALAARLGLGKLTLDENDVILLRLGRHTAALAYSEELEEIFSQIRVALLPGERRGECLRGLMRGNYAWAGAGGGALGLADDWLYLSRRYALFQENEGSFMEKLAVQVGLADFWLDVMEGRREMP